MISMCIDCRQHREIVRLDDFGRGRCRSCTDSDGAPVRGAVGCSLTARFRVGERVLAFTPIWRFDGVGTVVEVKFTVTGGDTPVYRVRLDAPLIGYGGDRRTYAEPLLRAASGLPILDEPRLDVLARKVIGTTRGADVHRARERDFVQLPIRLVSTGPTGVGIEVGPFDLDEAAISALRTAISSYDQEIGHPASARYTASGEGAS